MVVLSEIKPHSDAVHYFKDLPCYNKPIGKTKKKTFKKHWSISWTCFLWTSECNNNIQAFRGNAMSYKVEIIEKENPIVQLEASKSSIKDLFSDLLNETKSFKYQITLKVLLKNCKHNRETEFAPVYFNSLTKTGINHRFRLENSFQETLYMNDVWINKGSGWNVKSIESQYINISTYIPLSESFYIDLTAELRIPRKGLVDMKNKDKKC